jgi:hypothetical protein
VVVVVGVNVVGVIVVDVIVVGVIVVGVIVVFGGESHVPTVVATVPSGTVSRGPQSRAGVVSCPSWSTLGDADEVSVVEPLVVEPLVDEPLVDEPLVDEPLVDEDWVHPGGGPHCHRGITTM